MKSTFKKQMFVQTKRCDPSSSECSSSGSSSGSFVDPASYMKDGEFVFRAPPEAPVFEPTVEEFLDPLAYINKIRPIAEKTGICKVKPPSEWHPPFMVDVDHFKFTPRIQKLNELDANTRVKLYFLDMLATYWNYNGSQIRIPAINDKTVDMYSLYKLVELEGGFEQVSCEKKWCHIAQRMGYTQDKVVGPLLKSHYKRLLLPYVLFEKSKKEEGGGSGGGAATAAGIPTGEKKRQRTKKDATVMVKAETSVSSNCENGTPCGKSKLACPNPSPRKKAAPIPPPGEKRCTRSNCDENSTEMLVSDTFKNPELQDKNKELQRLTFYGPGPKILGLSKSSKNSPTKKSGSGETTGSTSGTDVLSESACLVCSKGDSEENFLLCDGCDDGYHTFCLVPPLTTVPKGEWRCPKCIDVVLNKASDTTFGFEQAEREYTLQQFGKMADQFKSNYFNMPVHLVPTQKVEQEYWKILSSMDSNVTVEYGADLHSMDHGSGFPTQLALQQGGDEYYKLYVESSWNLNNIPVLEGSVLGYINADISGMKIPWMYVGMCFSTFCWHNEDHWSYSINYLHWGEPKTWYGVPGYMAEKFEQVMRDVSPDLFRNQPDLLHQLVTNLNPNILMDRGVPVYHIDQAAGEFVLTFPRAYHAGFNHGYNFAEAVNFAPLDWIPLGRECIEHYTSLRRYCVFSHDELICKMASVPENLSSKLALATHQDMLEMLDVENRRRKSLLEWGVLNAEREAFELLADDERKCAECNTTCFLSAVTCKCSPKKVTCLRHFKQHCTCAAIEHTLRYRYTLDELPLMLDKLKEKADSVAVWAAKVHDALNVNTPRTITLTGLKELLAEAEEKNFPEDLSYGLLSKAIKSVQDALAVDFKNILSRKQTLSKKVTLTEIQSYYEELQRIPCVLPQENLVKQFLKFIDEFQHDVEVTIDDEKSTVATVNVLLKKCQFPNVEIRCVERLRRHADGLRFLEEIKERRAETPPTITLLDINQYITQGKTLAVDDERVKRAVSDLQAIKETIIAWEKKASGFLNEVGRDNVTKSDKAVIFEDLLEEAKTLKAVPPSRTKVAFVTKKVAVWRDKARTLLNIEHLSTHVQPFIEHIERVIDEGSKLDVDLSELKILLGISAEVKEWRKNVHTAFLGACKSYSLLEVLMPRRSHQRVTKFKKSSGIVAGEESETKISQDCSDFLESVNLEVKEEADVDRIIATFNVAEKREFELMRALQARNTTKKKQRDGTFCICNSNSTVLMKECSLCKDLYHEQCIKRLVNFWEYGDHQRNKTISATAENELPRIFLCPFCKRTKRPSVAVVNAALQQLEKLNIRALDAIAMKCLVDREAKWRESVDLLLQTPELAQLYSSIGEKTANRAPSHSGNASGGGGGGPFTISQENKDRLENLLFRGFLLELDIPQNDLIYKILQKLDACQDIRGVRLRKNSSKFAGETKHPMRGGAAAKCVPLDMSSRIDDFLDGKLGKDRGRKRIAVENNENDAVRAVKYRANNGAADKVVKNDSFIAPIKSNDKQISSIKRRRKISLACPLSKKLELMNQSAMMEPIDLDDDEMDEMPLTESDCVDVDDVEEEEEMECEAKECLKPSGEHLDWVQCDYCKNWLHMICIGVTKGEVDGQTEFMCSLCKSDDLQHAKEDNVKEEEEDDDVVLVESYSSNTAAICS